MVNKGPTIFDVLTIFYDDSSWDMTQWRSNRVYSAHGPSAVRAQNLPDVVFIQDKSPISAKNRFRVNIYFSLPWMELALRSSNVSLAWIQSPWHLEFCFPPSCCQLSDDKLYAAAESLSKQYDTDISSAFPSQFSFCSCFRSQLSTKSTILEVAHLLLIDYHVLSSTFSDVSTA